MILFLYGEDSYRSKQKLAEIVDQYKKARKSGLNLIDMDASHLDFADFYNHLKVSSMFAEKKLIVLRNIFSHKKFQEDFCQELGYLEKIEDIIVVYEDKAADQRLKIFKSLTQKTKFQEFAMLDGKKLRAWADQEFENHSAKINGDALELLLAFAGNNLWQLSGEIKKLAQFASGQTIKKSDVDLLVRPKTETDIFKTIDALAQKNKKQALVFLQRHLDNGDNPLYLMSMVAYQFKNLLIVKELAQKGLMYSSIVKHSGLHPFVVKKSYFQCAAFSLEYLKETYRRIFQLDLEIKTGKIEAETALNLLLSEI